MSNETICQINSSTFPGMSPYERRSQTRGQELPAARSLMPPATCRTSQRVSSGLVCRSMGSSVKEQAGAVSGQAGRHRTLIHKTAPILYIVVVCIMDSRYTICTHTAHMIHYGSKSICRRSHKVTHTHTHWSASRVSARRI